MVLIRIAGSIVAAGLMAAGAGTAYAQDFPTKPLRIITGGAGGGSDFNARQAAQALQGLGQPVVVDNRVSLLVGETGAKNAPDGHTLTIHGASLWLVTLLQKMPYDVSRDFSPVAIMTRELMMLAVHPSVPVKSVKDLIALAKAKPGELMYAGSVPGGPPMLGFELLKSLSGVNLLHVPYKGTTQVMTAIVSGEAHMTINDYGLIVPHAKSGRLRAIAITSLDRSTLAPGMTTIAESGIPGFEVTGVTAAWVPAKTPPAVITKLNQEIVRHLNRQEVKDRYLSNDMEVVASTPDQLGARQKSDMVKWGKLFADAGIKPQ